MKANKGSMTSEMANWDAVVKERRCTKSIGESTLQRRIYLVEDKVKVVKWEFGALISYEWVKANPCDVPQTHHGNAKRC